MKKSAISKTVGRTGDLTIGKRVGSTDIESLMERYERKYLDPVLRLAKKETSGKSQQINLEMAYEQAHLLRPPFSMSVMIALADLDPYLAGAIDAIATDVSACDMELKWTGEGEENERERKELNSFFFESIDPTNPMSLNEKIKACAIDYITVGNWNLELVEGGKKLVDLLHAPAEFIRVKKDMEGYMMVKNDKSAEFALYGDKNRGEKHQILRAINKHPGHRVYGKPTIKPLANTVLLNSLRDERNLSWFDQGTLADLLILIEESMGKEIKDRLIADYQNTSDGTQTMYILDGVGKSVVEQIKRELEGKSFEKLEDNNRQRVLTALRVPPAKVAIYEDANRANTLTQDEVFQNEVVKPIQRTFTVRFNHLIKYAFGFKEWEFIFKPMTLKDRLQEAKIDETYGKLGVFTVNEIRAKLNMSSVEGGEKRVMNTPLGLVDLDTWEIAIAQDIPPEAAKRLARIEGYKFVEMLIDIRRELKRVG